MYRIKPVHLYLPLFLALDCLFLKPLIRERMYYIHVSYFDDLHAFT